MYAAAVESAEKNKSKSVANNVGGGSRGIRRGFGFVDNRPEAIAQRKWLGVANHDPIPKSTPSTFTQRSSQQVLQRLAIADLDYAAIGNVLNDEKGVIAKLSTVSLYFCEGIESTKDDSPYDAPVYEKFGGTGVTFPHEQPPKILISMENNGSIQELTATIYHELRHAFDADTPALTDDSASARLQDLVNEGKTWKEELLFTIRNKDKLPDQFKEMVGAGFIIGDVDSGFLPNAEAIDENIASGYTDEYRKESRSVRFDPDRYKTSAKEKYNPVLMAEALK